MYFLLYLAFVCQIIVLYALLQDHEQDLVEVERHLGLTKADITRPHWSVIIPILNESKTIGKTVRHLIQVMKRPQQTYLMEIHYLTCLVTSI